MKGGFYLRLAKDGILKNRKFYFPYILTCICMVMMFYIVRFLSMSEDIRGMMGGEMIQGVLGVGVFVVAVFSLIFLYYTNSFLIRRRKKEFGLYNILGMGKRNLIKIIVWENVLTAVISLAAGLFFGILFSKLGELVAVRILGESAGFSMNIMLMPILWTVEMFLVIFVLIMVRMIVSICRLRPVEMLRSENVGEKPPKTNWLLALIGAVLLAGAYYLAVAVIDPMSAIFMFFVAVTMVIVATYLLFIAGSVALCKILQKNKNYYYKTNHFVSLSSMIYRMKRNGAGLASICILSTMMLVTISSTVCLYAQNSKSIENRFPNSFSISLSGSKEQFLDEGDTEFFTRTVDDVLAEYGEEAGSVWFRYCNVSAVQSGEEVILDVAALEQASWDELFGLCFIPLEDYNRLSGENRVLEDDEMLYYPKKMEFDEDTMNLEQFGTYKMERIASEPIRLGTLEANMSSTLLVVVKDTSLIERISQYERELIEKNGGGTLYPLYTYLGYDLDCSGDKEIDIYREVLTRVGENFEDTDPEEEVSVNYYIESRAEGIREVNAIYGGLLFLGVLLGAVFLFGTVLIMYYKQISEGYEDQGRFDILMKVGMTRKEVKKTINSQVLTVFFLPLFMAGVHLTFAFPLISKILQLMATAAAKEFLLVVTVCCYLVFALFYVIVYWVTSRSYYTIVNAKEKK